MVVYEGVATMPEPVCQKGVVLGFAKKPNDYADLRAANRVGKDDRLWHTSCMASRRSFSNDISVKAALYARVSTDDGRQTVANQVRQLRELAVAREFEIFREYTDEETGASANRAAFLALLRDARLRRFRVLLITDLDRLTRERVVDVVRRLDPEDRCVALISGRAVGEELNSASASAVGKNLMSALRNELMSKKFNVSEITIDKLSNVGFHCDVRSGKVIMLLLDPKVPGADRQFRILCEVKDQAIFENDESIHQLRGLVSRFWSTNYERVAWVTWKEAEEHGRTFRPS